jgi:hypothetical protein
MGNESRGEWEKLWAGPSMGGSRFLFPLLLGPVVGGVGGGSYGLLCDLLHMLLRWDGSLFGFWMRSFAEAGVAAGAIVGVCQAIDRYYSPIVGQDGGCQWRRDTTETGGCSTDGRAKCATGYPGWNDTVSH